MAKLAEHWVEIGAKISKFEKGMASVQAKMTAVGKKMTAVGKGMTMKVTLPLLAVGTAAVKMGADFDKAMTESLAIMGDVSTAMRKDMADMALEMSTKTTFAAHELAKAYFFLASAGMDAAQSIKALPVVAKFAQAGAFDLATATDLLTDAQTALGLSSKDATENQKNLIQVSDVLVKANTLANASVQQFSESLTNRAAAALVNVNKSMEEGVAVLAAYADKGVKGQVAGMRLAMMLNALDIAARKNQKAWRENGLALFDAQGEMRSIGDIIGDLEGALGDMTTEQRAATLATLGFNVRTKASILTLMGSSEKIKQWKEDLKSAGGTTEKVAEKQMQAFSNQMIVLKNILVKVGIQLSKVLMPIIRDLVDNHIKPAIERFSRLSEAKKKMIIIVAGLVAAFGPLLIIFGTLIGTVIPKLIMSIKAIGIAMKFLAIHPLMLLAVGLTGIIVLYLKVKAAQDEVIKASQRLSDQSRIQAQRWSAIAQAAGLTTKEMMALTKEYDGNYSAMFRAIKQGKEGKELQGAYTKTIGKLKGEIEKETGALDGLTEAERKSKEELDKLRLEIIATTKAEGEIEEATKKWAETLEDLGVKTIEEKRKRIIEVNETLKKLHAEYKDGKIHIDDYGGAVKSLNEESKELSETVIESALPAIRDLGGETEKAPIQFENLAYGIETALDKILKKWPEFIDVINEDLLYLAQTGIMGVLNAFHKWGEEGGNILTNLGEAMHNFVGVALDALKQLVVAVMMSAMKTIAAKKIEAIASQIANVMKSIPFPINLMLVGGAIAAVSALFSGLKPKSLEKGGWIPRPMLVEAGHGPRGEIIAQPSTLAKIITQEMPRQAASPEPAFAPTPIQPIVNIYAQRLDRDTIDRAGEEIIRAVNRAKNRGL